MEDIRQAGKSLGKLPSPMSTTYPRHYTKRQNLQYCCNGSKRLLEQAFSLLTSSSRAGSRTWMVIVYQTASYSVINKEQENVGRPNHQRPKGTRCIDKGEETMSKPNNIILVCTCYWYVKLKRRKWRKMYGNIGHIHLLVRLAQYLHFLSCITKANHLKSISIILPLFQNVNRNDNVCIVYKFLTVAVQSWQHKVGDCFYYNLCTKHYWSQFQV